ncbi:SMI1/KNR4 family protein [Hymenobacter sp. CRA2]|uniref:SMI1/KNR4 family protein n=1 Tax=Hymenobacter sp. CRA2 TaxID=1955620 RepID=UPI00098FEDD3|nr:SMI1/KNR4 family protein [Hymenobacter sp. CRA2]OON69468.1 hypothetical protein B0919_09340 [Hymenobacter sp. CRA2]
MADLLAAIERKYETPLPALYHRLYHDGMLDWFLDGGFPNPTWQRDIFPRLSQRPPVLLFAQDFELYRPEDVLTWELPEDWDPGCRFVPLGQTGGGDLYAFCPTLAADAELPVTLSLHDDNQTTVVAPSMEAFIFREMLDRATSFDEYALEGYAGFEELRADLLRAAEAIRPYLRPAWHALLTKVYTRPLQQETVVLPRRRYTIDTLLPQAEFEQLLVQEMGVAPMNTTFEHFAG